MIANSNSNFQTGTPITWLLDSGASFHVIGESQNIQQLNKFALDNGVYFEFHPNHCLVKSQGANEILLQGSLGPDGLYVFPNLHLQSSIAASSASCFVSNSVTNICSDVNNLNSDVKTNSVARACTRTGSLAP